METKTKSKSIISIILSIAFVLALSVVTLFAGCGKGNKNNQTATPEGTEQNQAEAQNTTETKVVCTAIFNANGGEFADGSDITSVDQAVFNDQNFNFTEDAENIVPTRKDYTFVGWATAPKAKRTISKLTAENTASEITFYAIWASKDECYCYFNANGGYFQNNSDADDKIISYQVIKSSNMIQKFADGYYYQFKDSKNTLLNNYTPVREGYEFAGFAATEESTTPVQQFRVVPAAKYKEDFYAIWKEVKTATFDANGGTFADGNATLSFSQTMENADSVANFNSDKESLEVARDGRIFLGWSKSKTAYSYKIVNNFEFEADEHNVTYYAIWTKYDKCTVTFDAIGGEIVNGKFVAFAEGDNNGVFANGKTTQAFTQNLKAATNGYYSFKAEAKTISGNAAPVKDGYKFVGWVKCWTEKKVVKHTSTPVKYFQVSAQRGVFGYSAVWEKIETK